MRAGKKAAAWDPFAGANVISRVANYVFGALPPQLKAACAKPRCMGAARVYYGHAPPEQQPHMVEEVTRLEKWEVCAGVHKF